MCNEETVIHGIQVDSIYLPKVIKKYRYMSTVEVPGYWLNFRLGLGRGRCLPGLQNQLQFTSTTCTVTAVLVFQLVSIYHQYTKQTHRHIVGNLGIISLKHTFFVSFSSRLHFLLVIRPRISTLAGLNCCTLLYTFSLQHHGFKIWHDQPHKTQRRGK